MGDYYLGEIRAFAIGFAPKNWAQCNGQLLPVAQNTALFSLLGTTYGGNGVSTFALPDLRSRTSVGIDATAFNGIQYQIGANGGLENVALTPAQMPAHNHMFACNNGNTGNVNPANGNYYANTSAAGNYYKAAASPPPGMLALEGSTLSSVGTSTAHSNLQPTAVLEFCIATAGIYPSRS